MSFDRKIYLVLIDHYKNIDREKEKELSPAAMKSNLTQRSKGGNYMFKDVQHEGEYKNTHGLSLVYEYVMVPVVAYLQRGVGLSHVAIQYSIDLSLQK